MGKKTRRVEKLTQDDYENAIDIYREFRTVESVSSALQISNSTSKRLIEKGYPNKAWHSIVMVLNEEKTIESLRDKSNQTEKEKNTEEYKKMISYFEATLKQSMTVENGRPTGTPNMNMIDVRRMYDMKCELLSDEIANGGYVSPFTTWTQREIQDFLTGKKRPK